MKPRPPATEELLSFLSFFLFFIFRVSWKSRCWTLSSRFLRSPGHWIGTARNFQRLRSFSSEIEESGRDLTISLIIFISCCSLYMLRKCKVRTVFRIHICTSIIYVSPLCFLVTFFYRIPCYIFFSSIFLLTLHTRSTFSKTAMFLVTFFPSNFFFTLHTRGTLSKTQTYSILSIVCLL